MVIKRKWFRYASVILGVCICTVGAVADELPEPKSTNIYKSDFSKPVNPEHWSGTDLVDIPSGGKMLKGWGELKLTLADLPDHEFLRVRIKMAVIGTVDGYEMGPGPDHWTVLDGDGTTLFHTTFRTAKIGDKALADGGFGQSFPDEYPDGRNASQTGAIDIGKLGYGSDCTYDIELVFPHTEPTLVLELFAGNPGAKDGETYGYRSVEVDAVAGPTNPDEAELARLWTAVNGEDSAAANKARWALIAAGKKGADFVRRKQLEASKMDPKAQAARKKQIAGTIAKWIGGLDAEAFRARVEARTELKKLEPDAIPALEQEVKKTKSKETRTALHAIIKSLNAKKKAKEGDGSHAKTVAARVAHVLRIHDIAASGRKVRASTNWHPSAALDDGFVPLKMTGHTVPHFSWRSKDRAPDQWVQYEYPKARRFDSAMVYWFEDRGWEHGAKLPVGWSLVYLDGKTWKPVKARGRYGITYGAFDRVEFDPVTTTAIRLKCKAQKGHFAGLMEFRLGEKKPAAKAEE